MIRISPVRRTLRRFMPGNLSRRFLEFKGVVRRQICKSRIFPQTREIGIPENLIHSVVVLSNGALHVLHGMVDRPCSNKEHPNRKSRQWRNSKAVR